MDEAQRAWLIGIQAPDQPERHEPRPCRHTPVDAACRGRYSCARLDVVTVRCLPIQAPAERAGHARRADWRRKIAKQIEGRGIFVEPIERSRSEDRNDYRFEYE